MSTKLTGYVWDGCAASGMKLSSVAIMARLADFSNDEGVCWPSIETIARQIGAGMSTVRTAIARLEAEGWLTRKARRQGNRNASNVYQLNVAKLQAAAFSQLSDSDPSKSDASKSDPSKFDASKSGKKAGFHPSESGGDPSVKSKHDPSDKKPSRPDASQPDTQTDEQGFLTRHPDAVVFSPKKRQWGTQDDLTCAQWLWKKIIALYEQAAECDGEVVRPKEPNWTAWANEIRLMCVQDGRTHKQICEMYSRVSRDPFWCRNVLSPSKLREKWDELSLRLSPSVTRESDLVPSVPATSIIQDKAKKVLALKVDPESPESFMLRPKRRRWVNEKYTRWVKTQPCACCGKPADDPHHLIGHGQGGMGTKAHDLFVLPLCRKHHDELHADTVAFEEKYGSQLELIFRFIDRALATGVLA